MTCSVRTCDRKHYADGWCAVHYYRWRKFGDPLEHLPVRTKPGYADGYWMLAHAGKRQWVVSLADRRSNQEASMTCVIPWWAILTAGVVLLAVAWGLLRGD